MTAEEVHLNQEITPNLVSDQFIETPGIEGYIPDTSRIPDFMADTPKDTAPIEKTEVVSVCFKPGGKSYFFDPRGTRFRVGSHVIVDTARGAEFGEVTAGNTSVPSKDVVQPLRAIIRPATREDAIKNDENRVLEKEALKICEEKIREHGLEMELVEAQYTFDRAKLLFYFTSDSRVDFRELVKDLAFKFHTRIELRQIGIRDEAKMIGGIGVCGRPLCCASFLSNFVQVSIKMAKEQNLSLNSGKISGTCGRLMCCLHYEYDTYREEAALTPPVGSVVQTADGNGTVVETNPLAQCVKVRLFDKQDQAPVVYHRDKVTVIAKKGSADAKNIASAANTEKN